MNRKILLSAAAAFCIQISASFAQTNYYWGFSGARAVPGDYDGDGLNDLAVYYEQAGTWYIYSPANNAIIKWNFGWGFTGGEPVALDYDGDGITDLGIFGRDTGDWYVCSIGLNEVLVWGENWGASGMQQAAGDYSGTGADEIAVYEENSGAWYIAKTPEPEEITDMDQLAVMYSNAMVNAANLTADKICKNLTAITADNTNIYWRTNPDTGRNEVKVASFMSHSVATNYYHPGATTSLKYATSWITVAPELKTFCRNYSGTNLVLRLKQLIGLPATSGNDTVVEYWVDPAYLMRPSSDPQISDSVAEMDFHPDALFSTVSTNYINWFNANIISSDYGMTNGVWGGALPWTRLGYTYDWALPTNKIVGLSEFVIPGKLLWDTAGVEASAFVTLVTNAIYYGSQD